MPSRHIISIKIRPYLKDYFVNRFGGIEPIKAITTNKLFTFLIQYLTKNKKDLFEREGDSFLAVWHGGFIGEIFGSGVEYEKRQAQIADSIISYLDTETDNFKIKKLAESELKNAKIALLEEKSPKPAGAGSSEEGPRKEEMSLEDKCKHEWENDPKIKKEFASLETYTGFKRAESRRRVKILGRKG